MHFLRQLFRRSLCYEKSIWWCLYCHDSKNMGADLVYAWPGAEIAVMGAEGAVNIAFRRAINESEDKEATRAQLVQEYKDKS